MNYDGLIRSQVAKAYSLLGAPAVTITHTEKGDYDPVTGTTAAGVTTTETALAKFDSSWRSMGFKFGADLLHTGDIAITIPALGLTFEPRPGDSITTDRGTFTVVDVRPSFCPGGAPSEFSMLVRQ